MNAKIRALADDFLLVLGEAQELRGKRMDFAKDGSGELEWVQFEREVMLGEVNRERRRLGLDTVSIDDIKYVEQNAVGHVDYSRKFALYCAELATGYPAKNIRR